MIGIKEAKGNFFDRPTVMDAVDKAKIRVFLRFGGRVRLTAQRSMRRRLKIAEQGKPPSAHVGTIRDLLFFSYDSNSVVIGPTLSNRPSGAPKLMEYGGVTPNQGVILVPASEAKGELPSFGRPKKGSKKLVAIKTSGPWHYKPHPFMQPAFEEALPGLPVMWQNSIR